MHNEVVKYINFRDIYVNNFLCAYFSNFFKMFWNQREILRFWFLFW